MTTDNKLYRETTYEEEILKDILEELREIKQMIGRTYRYNMR